MRILLSLFLILSNTAYALQIIDVEPGKTYKAKISISNINTVMMHNKVHLLSLHGTSDTVTFQKDEETGHAFIQTKTNVPFSLIVTDENQNTYTLLLVPLSIPAETIILKPVETMDYGQQQDEKAIPHKIRKKRIVKEIINTGKIKGYKHTVVNKGVNYFNETLIVHKDKFTGSYNVSRYIIKNITPSEMTLAEPEFKNITPNISLIAFVDNKTTLKPDETTVMLVITDD